MFQKIERSPAQFQSTERARLVAFVTRITTDFPKNSMTTEINQQNPKIWAEEGFGLARDQVYPGITENTLPGQTYQANAQKVSERRIALAGYRLAAILNRIL
jgi:hypothetical protein